MLANAIGNYVDSLSEREFDAPFIALLRLHGFRDIHFLHGAFEFGKDFIAKRSENGTECQYAFQTKAGNIGLAEWNECRGQIDMLRTNSLAHPNFEKAFPRRARFVTTGRLIGAAGLAAQDYKQHLETLGEVNFSTWDRDTLVEMLAVDPASLSGSPVALLQVLGSQRDRLNFAMLERHSRSWIRSSCNTFNLRDSLEAAVIANHCRLENRIDLACYTALMLIRSTWATAHAHEPLPDSAAVAISTGKALFRHYATNLWQACPGKYLEPDALIREDRTPAGYVTYPVRCLTILEILAMLAWLDEKENPSFSATIVEYLSEFVSINAGASHPVSDKWGISIVPAAFLFYKHGRLEVLTTFLRSTVKWVADRYDNGNLGLAGPYASPEEETAYLLGSPFEHVTHGRRPESYVATLILDLCSVLEQQELFDLARNEFLAVRICLPMLEVDNSPSQYCIHSSGQRYEPNMPYEEIWNPVDGWKTAPHHKRGPSAYYPETTGAAWDQMAISCVVRDRHFVQSWRRLLA